MWNQVSASQECMFLADSISCVSLFKACGMVVLVKWAITVRPPSSSSFISPAQLMHVSQPAPTGLDDMPKFNSSLDCLDAPHFYHQDTPEGTFYTLPVSSVSGGTEIAIHGAAPGTLTLQSSTSFGEEHIMARVSVRSNSSGALMGVEIESAAHEDAEGAKWLTLGTPDTLSGGQGKGKGDCMRHDMTVYAPPTLRNLTINAQSPVHLHTAFDGAPRVLVALSISTAYNSPGGGAYENILKGEKGLQADELRVVARGATLSALSPRATEPRSPRHTAALSRSSSSSLRGTISKAAARAAPQHTSTATPARASQRSRSRTHTTGPSPQSTRLEYANARFYGLVDVETRS